MAQPAEPGREERCKTHGRDASVIEIKSAGERASVSASVMSLVEASGANISGAVSELDGVVRCTGGQASVSLAEQLGKRLRGRNGVDVVGGIASWRHRAMKAMISPPDWAPVCVLSR